MFDCLFDRSRVQELIVDVPEGKIPLSYDYCIQADLEYHPEVDDTLSLGQRIADINLVDISLPPTTSSSLSSSSSSSQQGQINDPLNIGQGDQ